MTHVNMWPAPLQAQRFLATVLLPHVRQDIRENRRLHFALFQSLKKAAYKPDAFFKVHAGSERVSVRPCVKLISFLAL